MMSHPNIAILWVSLTSCERHRAWLSDLQAFPHVRLACQPHLPDNLDPYQVVITAQDGYSPAEVKRLTEFASRRGHGWLVWTEAPQAPLPQICGVQLQTLDTPTELRVLFDQPETPLAARLDEAIYVAGTRQTLNIIDSQTNIVMYADWRYTHQAVLTQRPVGSGAIATTTLQDTGHPVVRKVLYRLMRQMAGEQPLPREMGAALLGYAPSVGRLHGLGLMETQGFILRAACDLDPSRRAQFQTDFPGVTIYPQAEALAADDSVDLVIVTTPPNTHARLSSQMIAAGKHVVCEKPLALNTHETAAMADSARQHRRLLCCHQNRRFDADYLAIERAVNSDLIGDLFYLETFVGGFQHPCGYWHSHTPICGGTTYDWGAHYLDWIVALMPETVHNVRCTRHQRVWHDVTNADQERIQIRFAHGGEAEFLHSDVAAARKPKWYLLGTRGAIVGHWQEVCVHRPDPVHYYDTHSIPITEMTPRLTAYCRDSYGRIYARDLPAPRPSPFAFHRNLADHIHLGEPLAAPLADSMRVVAILEAASRSAANGGSLEVIDG